MSQNKYHGLLLPAVVIMSVSVASVATPKSAFAQCGDGVTNCDPPSPINLGPSTTNLGGASTVENSNQNQTNVEINSNPTANGTGGNGFGGAGGNSSSTGGNGFGGAGGNSSSTGGNGFGGAGGNSNSSANSESRSNATGTGGQSTANGGNSTGTGGQSTANGGNSTGTGGGGGSVNLKGGLNLVLPNTATPQGPTQPGTGFASFSVGRNACKIDAIIAGSYTTNNSTTFWVFNTSSGQSSPSEEVKANGSLAFQAAISMATGRTSILPGEGCDTPKPVTVPSQELVPPVVVPPAPKGVCTPGQAGNGAYLRNGVYVCAR